jgi:hypothetical protein
MEVLSFFKYIFDPIWTKFAIGKGYKILLSVYKHPENGCSESHTLRKVKS